MEMNLSEQAKANIHRYEAAMHAMQTGVAYVMEKDPSETSPKHLRVGVNSSLIEQAAIAEILVEKGLLTWDEYYKKLADVAERERNSYKEHVNNLYGDGRINIDLA
jgi:hypothetical protein